MAPSTFRRKHTHTLHLKAFDCGTVSLPIRLMRLISKFLSFLGRPTYQPHPRFEIRPKQL